MKHIPMIAMLLASVGAIAFSADATPAELPIPDPAKAAAAGITRSPNALFLSGDTVSYERSWASGSAVGRIGELTIRAESIQYEKTTKTIRCTGPATVVAGNATVRGTDLTVDPGVPVTKLHVLDTSSPRKVTRPSNPPAAPSP